MATGFCAIHRTPLWDPPAPSRSATASALWCREHWLLAIVQRRSTARAGHRGSAEAWLRLVAAAVASVRLLLGARTCTRPPRRPGLWRRDRVACTHCCTSLLPPDSGESCSPLLATFYMAHPSPRRPHILAQRSAACLLSNAFKWVSV